MRKNWVIPGVLIVLIIIVSAGWLLRRKWESGHVYVHTRPIQTPLGWGYEILVGDTVYIHQEFIPAIQGRHGFKTQEDAVRVGRFIIEKMKKQEGEGVSVKNLLEMGVVDSTIAGPPPPKNLK